MALRHLWGERWLHWRPSASKAPDRTARPAQNSLAPPHIHAHLNSRQDTFVNLPGESQVVRKNGDWINRRVSGPTLLTECSGTRMRNKGHAQQGVRAHTNTLRMLPALGVCRAGWGFPAIEAESRTAWSLEDEKGAWGIYFFLSSAVFLMHPHTVVIGSPRLPLVENVSLKDSHDRNRY